MLSLTNQKGGKKREREKQRKDAVGDFVCFNERESSFSLKIRAIRPSAVFGTRGRTALRGEGFAWVPNLWSFFKLLEVGVSPYLGFTLYLSVLQCFGLLKALNGRLIGSKAWNREC